MVDLVAARRQQWELLRDAAINPPSSSPLVLHGRQSPGETAGEEGEEEEDDMEKMLGEMTLISPPSTTPLLEDSLTEGGSGSANSSLDTLAAMRRRLMETEDGSEGAVTPPTTTPPSDTASGKKNGANLTHALTQLGACVQFCHSLFNLCLCDTWSNKLAFLYGLFTSRGVAYVSPSSDSCNKY